MVKTQKKLIFSGENISFWEDLSLFLIRLKYDVVTVGINGEGVRKCFIEGALPPFFVGVGLPFESVGGEGGGSEVKDGHLLSGEALKRLCAMAGREKAVVGVHDAIDAKVSFVAHQQGDVAESVVFALACAAEIAYLVPSFLHAVACGFGQVVVFLLVYLDESVTELVRNGVAVADDDIGLCYSRPITADEAGGML